MHISIHQQKKSPKLLITTPHFHNLMSKDTYMNLISCKKKSKINIVFAEIRNPDSFYL